MHEDKISKEIISVVMTNTAPYLKHTRDLGDKIVNANAQILLESIFLKILKINTDAKAGKKQKPRKSLNELEVKILFK